jgi:hypothetical protein
VNTTAAAWTAPCCTVDFSSNSTGGDYKNFANTCATAGGEVYEVDYTVTCPFGVGATIDLNVNNLFTCAAKVCTSDDIQTYVRESSYSSTQEWNCITDVHSVDVHSVTTQSVTSSSMEDFSGSVALLVAAATGVLSLVDIY